MNIWRDRLDGLLTNIWMMRKASPKDICDDIQKATGVIVSLGQADALYNVTYNELRVILKSLAPSSEEMIGSDLCPKCFSMPGQCDYGCNCKHKDKSVNKDVEAQLSHARNQMEIAKMYAMYWHAMATTGAATIQNVQQGRDPTEEEKAKGMVIGYRGLTDLEKIKRALETMTRHIHLMSECNDRINKLILEQDNESRR